MKKKIIFIVIVVMILGTAIVVGTISKTAKKDENKGDSIQSMNTVNDKKTDKVENKENTVKENTVKENKVKEEKKEDTKVDEAKEEKQDIEETKNNTEEKIVTEEEPKVEEKTEVQDNRYGTFEIDGLETENNGNNPILISEEYARQLARIGFEESIRIVGEEIARNEKSETVKIEKVSPNNFFTRQGNERDEKYTDIVRTCYSVTRRDEEISGVTIYVDATTGIIIGARAFGD
ncbi:MAG: hypothetical protein IKF52_03590 [Clostridia bacterium]|nr:hypothetical protein [Clostridia bacterium]